MNNARERMIVRHHGKEIPMNRPLTKQECLDLARQYRASAAKTLKTLGQGREGCDDTAADIAEFDEWRRKGAAVDEEMAAEYERMAA